MHVPCSRKRWSCQAAELIPFEGSSRSTRFTTMAVSLSVNHPFGRNHVFVCTAEAGIRKNAAMPTTSVISPSIKKSHLLKSVFMEHVSPREYDLHPAKPWTPSRCKSAKASKEVTIWVRLNDTQNQLECQRAMSLYGINVPQADGKFPTGVEVGQP